MSCEYIDDDDDEDDASSSSSSEWCAVGKREREREAKDEENGNNTSDKKNLRLFKTYRVQVLVREVHRQSFQVENHLLPLLCCVLLSSSRVSKKK